MTLSDVTHLQLTLQHITEMVPCEWSYDLSKDRYTGKLGPVEIYLAELGIGKKGWQMTVPGGIFKAEELDDVLQKARQKLIGLFEEQLESLYEAEELREIKRSA